MNGASHLLIRADASTAIGTGHVMRCLALAQAFRDRGGSVTFLVAQMLPVLQTRLEREGCRGRELMTEAGGISDAEQTAAAATECGAVCVVADGYHFQAPYYEHLVRAGLHVLALDDHVYADHYEVDFLLNQNPYASEAMYPARGAQTTLLLGPRFALLRREFVVHAGWERSTSPTARRVLVTLGGTDPDGVTLKVLRALNRLPASAIEATVIVGGGNPRQEAVQTLAGTMRVPMRVLVQPENMAALYREADIAIAAGGSSCYELAMLGLPALLLTLAENQRRVAASLAEKGVAESLGWHAEVTEERIASTLERLLADSAARARMAKQGRMLVDGFGARRVCRFLTGSPLWLRPALQRDARLLWEWVNDPIVRALSFSPDPIPWEQHRRWFEERLANGRCPIFLGFNAEDVPVGQVRFDARDDGGVDVGIHTAPLQRGRGYGTAMLTEGIRLLATKGVSVFHAFIRPGNAASLRSFAKAGFTEAGRTTVKGVECIHVTCTMP